MKISLSFLMLVSLVLASPSLRRAQANEAVLEREFESAIEKEDDAYWSRLLQQAENFSIDTIPGPNLRPTTEPSTPEPPMPDPSTPRPPSFSLPTVAEPTQASPTSPPRTPDPFDCSQDGFCNENCSELTPDPDCSTDIGTEPRCMTVVSDFEGGDEAWTIIGDAQGGQSDPDWAATDGNPGGYISAKDDGYDKTWYFRAPIKFGGNFAGSYGQTLSFSLRQSLNNSQYNDRDVIIKGGGLEVWYDTEMNPGINWTFYSVTIDEAAGWKLNQGSQAATETDIRTALSSIDDLYIRGEYRNGDDVGGLDNVILETVCLASPSPAPVDPTSAPVDALL